ncbi:50S ribosomal protein L10 [bacterium endosymbiont of Pedicinus badii]|uniref:50S ribosomal protein L10 n=1 Tax=bacterium endosymbiont of Pedicinus badii TaxID=1719126 RepID=UPI0009B9A201|nr:50S ribosomal protein L10 [bacterium endosymbiont of Pedicinus badii]OQM34042.1 hypothetical protein AOQ89_01625 [bacterium endosymbiont of Pedicinus badii]
MALSLKKKQKIVSKIKKLADESISVVVADFYKINSEKMNTFRKCCQKSEVFVQVVKNTLLRRAFKNTKFQQLESNFCSSTLVAFSKNSPGSAAKVLTKLKKEDIIFKIKGIIFDGKIIHPSKISTLASLPNKKEAIQILLILLQESCILKLIKILSYISKKKKL